MAAYKMTPKRRAALKKAQAASARKRRGKGSGKLAKANRSNTRLKKAMKYTAIGVGAAAAVGYGVYARKNLQNARKTFRAPRTDYNFKSDFSKAYTKKRKPRNPKASVGNTGRVFVSDTGYAKRKAAYRQEARLRQLRKAGDRSLYNAGLQNNSSGRVFTTGRRRNKKKQVTYY